MFADRYGPWAVIVGGSEGIGACFATRLAAQGLNLVLMARKSGLLEALASELRSTTSVEVRTLSLDITTSDFLAKVAETTDDIDVGLLIYNAGSSPPTSFLDASLDSALNVVKLNPIGQLALAHHFGRRMRERGKGGMIFIGSVAGAAGGALTAAYSAAKAFTHVLAEALWVELKPFGIDVLGFVIGATRTPYALREGLALDHADVVTYEPDDVARQALENIGNGPIKLPGDLGPQFRAIMSMDRGEAATAMSSGTATILGGHSN